MALAELIARLLVVAGIFAVSMFLLRRYATRQMSRPAKTAEGFRIVSRMSLGKGSQVLLLESGGRTFVVGVGQAQVLQVGAMPGASAPESPQEPPDPRAPAVSATALTQDTDPSPIARQKEMRAYDTRELVMRLARWLGFARPAAQSDADFGSALAAAMSPDPVQARAEDSLPEGIMPPSPAEVTRATPATAAPTSQKAAVPESLSRKGTAKKSKSPVTAKAQSSKTGAPPPLASRRDATGASSLDEVARHYSSLLIDTEELSRSR